MKRVEQGYLLLGRIRLIPIRIHWTAPLGAFLFGRFEIVPAFWVAFLALILIHELGHAVAVRLSRAQVTMIDLDGAGGLCHWRGTVGAFRRAFISWGGVLGQLLAFGAAHAILVVFGPPVDEYQAQVADVYTRANLWLAAFNLIPIRHLDGAKAWKILPLLYHHVWARLSRSSQRREQQRAAREEIARLDRLEGANADVSKSVDDVLSLIASEVNNSSKREPSE